MRTRRPQRWASRTSWVTNTRVACRRRCRPNSSSTTCSPVLPSRLPVGSSARMICGRGLKARAMATRCCSPPESCAGKCSARCARPTSANSALAVAKAAGFPAKSSGRATASSAVMVGTRWHDWKTMPILLPRTMASSSSLRPRKSRPATRTEPDVARSRPATIINSEVLPDPLGPTTATDSPAPISRLTRFKISTGPARLDSLSETPLRAMTGLATIAPASRPRPCLGLCKLLPQERYLNRHHEKGTHPMRKVPSKATLANMGVVVLLCNWLIAAWAGGTIAQAEQPLRIVVLGDSLVAGLGLKPSDAFPAQLERALKARGHVVDVINAGVSGDTTAGGLARIAWAVPEQTDAVIVELGANDALRGLDPARARSNLDKIITTIKANGTEVLLAGMFAPRSLGKDYVRAFESIYPDLANKYALILYPFFLQGVAMDPKLNLDDGPHPNARGVPEITKNTPPAVEQLTERARAKHATAPKG